MRLSTKSGEEPFWIGTNDGVSRFDGKTFTTFPLPKAPVKEPNTVYSADRITSIEEDKNGNLWFGTDGFGLCKYDGKTITHFTTEDGLPDNVIYDLMEDSKGNLWIGTFFGGVSKYDGEKFTNFTKDGLVEGLEVSGFFEEDNGEIGSLPRTMEYIGIMPHLPASRGNRLLIFLKKMAWRPMEY